MPLLSLDQRICSCHIPVIFYVIFLFIYFCNEMQQMCNRQGKHTAAAHDALGGQSLTAAFK